MAVYVRRLREDDLTSVLTLSTWLHKNSRYRKFNFNEDKVKALLSQSLNTNSDVYVCIALEKGSDKILGYFHGYVDYHYFSDEKYAGEWAVIVAPDHRKKAPIILKTMILDFEKWAIKKGAVEISIASSTEASGTSYKKFLQRMNYRDVGFLCVKG